MRTKYIAAFVGVRVAEEFLVFIALSLRLIYAATMRSIMSLISYYLLHRSANRNKKVFSLSLLNKTIASHSHHRSVSHVCYTFVMTCIRMRCWRKGERERKNRLCS